MSWVSVRSGSSELLRLWLLQSSFLINDLSVWSISHANSIHSPSYPGKLERMMGYIALNCQSGWDLPLNRGFLWIWADLWTQSLNTGLRFSILQGYNYLSVRCWLLRRVNMKTFCDLSRGRERCRCPLSFLNVLLECAVQKSAHTVCTQLDKSSQSEYSWVTNTQIKKLTSSASQKPLLLPLPSHSPFPRVTMTTN